MTDAAALKPYLGRYGVWTGEPVTPEEAVDIENLGYGAVWAASLVRAELDFVEPILERTSSLMVATGVLVVWDAPAKTVAKSFHRIDDAYPGRFLLGVGVGHPENIDDYPKPYDALLDYLHQLDDAGVPTSRRVIGALGPRMVRLAARHSAGTHPYLTTPEHTRWARELGGNSMFLAPEHKVVMSADAKRARAIGRMRVGGYLDASNYVNNWKRLGFTEADVSEPGSDRLIDSMVAYGSADDIAGRLNEHIEAGADHVAIQVLGGWDELLPTLSELAGPLGLTSRIVGWPPDRGHG